MSGPLSGIKIVDLTTVISGPSATMLLADQGADIIKVESISAPDHARGAGFGSNHFTSVFLNNNRNKKALALDLKDPRGRLRYSLSAKMRTLSSRTSGPGSLSDSALVRPIFARLTQR